MTWKRRGGQPQVLNSHRLKPPYVSQTVHKEIRLWLQSINWPCALFHSRALFQSRESLSREQSNAPKDTNYSRIMVSRICSGICNNKSLQLICDEADAYPQNLAPKYGSRKLLRAEAEKLRAERERLFDEDEKRSKVFMTEVLSGSHGLFNQPYMPPPKD